jgi:hypothetical protein
VTRETRQVLIALLEHEQYETESVQERVLGVLESSLPLDIKLDEYGKAMRDLGYREGHNARARSLLIILRAGER